MPKKKREEIEEVVDEQELEQGDIYDEDSRQELVEEDEISAMEAAFMHGYEDA